MSCRKPRRVATESEQLLVCVPYALPQSYTNANYTRMGHVGQRVAPRGGINYVRCHTPIAYDAATHLLNMRNRSRMT